MDCLINQNYANRLNARYYFIITLILMLFIILFPTGNANAEKAPEEARIPSFEISRVASQHISSLGDDAFTQDTFLSTLARILQHKKLSESDKVDAFYLMLKKIGFSFTGTVSLPPNYSYFKTYRWRASTFIMFQQSLQPLKYDVKGMLDLVHNGCGRNIVRCSNALLLTAILNPKDVEPVINNLINPSKLENFEVPPILIHHLSLSTVLCRNHQLAAKLGKIAIKIPSEESQEDILCALGMFESKLTSSEIKQFLKDVVNQKFDNTVNTGLLILLERFDRAEFENYLSVLISSVKDPETKKTLSDYSIEQIKEGAFGGSSPNGWTKVWDGYDITIYDDGLQIKYSDTFINFIEY